MKNLVLLATAWGPKHGGINSFNHDFAIGLKKAIDAEGQVFCAVPNASDDEIAVAANIGIKILSVTGAVSSGDFDRNWTDDVFEQLRLLNTSDNLIWIGHDVKSGFAATRAAERHGGRSALIMHMDYLAYQGLVHEGEVAWEKHERQRELFRSPSTLFAVGPLLKRSCDRISGSKRTALLIPGFPDEIGPNDAPDDLLAAITFGRMGSGIDRIKQGQLVVAAFSSAVAQARRINGPRSLINGYLSVIGVDGDATTRRKLFEKAAHYSGQIINILPAMYTENRSYTMSRIRGSNLAMMLSWHEGFGLVGWEAIAHEVPLIVGINSGIYELIDDRLGGSGVGCIQGIRIEGSRGDDESFSTRDVKRIANAVLRVASDLERAKRDAAKLKKALIDELVCTWKNTGIQFLHEIDKLGVVSPVPAALTEMQSDHELESSGEVSACEPNSNETLDVKHFALADKDWKSQGPHEDLDKAIASLKSCNWHRQNPGISSVRDLLAKQLHDISQVFLIGRNIYQAAHGRAREAESFVRSLSTELKKYPPENANALFEGILFEIYCDSGGTLRSIPKVLPDSTLRLKIFEAANEEILRPAVQSLRRRLGSSSEFRYPVLPGKNSGPQDVFFRLTEPTLNEHVWNLERLSIGKRQITARVQDNNSSYEFIRKWGEVIKADDMLELIGEYFNIPVEWLNPNVDRGVSFSIPKGLGFISCAARMLTELKLSRNTAAS